MGSIKKPPNCETKFCRRAARRFKTKKGYGYNKLCTTCDKKRWREENPMKAAYQTLRYNSTRRHVFFDLTFEEFSQFCYENDYMAGKGRTKGSFSIDRVVEGKLPGYTISNIRKVTIEENTLKEHTRRRKKILMYDWQSKEAKVI